MNKLTRLKLTEVLSHKDTRVDLGEELTIFTGMSDSGKSSAIRGLLQLCENKPAGIDLLRHGAKRGACSEVTAEGTTESGEVFTIVRRRGKSSNEYEVNGQVLRAFGTGAPEEVRGLLRLSEHAFQLQSDGHFLLSSTDGEVARVMGRTVGLSQIDTAFQEVRKLKTVNDTNLRCAEADKKKEQDALACFTGLEEADRAVLACERLDEFRKNKITEVKEIESVLGSLARIPNPVDTGAACKLLSGLGKVEQDAKSLSEKLHKITIHTRRMESVPPSVDLEPAEKLFRSWGELEKKEHTLSDVCAKMRELLRKLDNVPAVDEADIKGAHRSLGGVVDAETRRDGLECDFERLVRLGRSFNAVPVDCSVDIEGAKETLASTQGLEKKIGMLQVVLDRQGSLRNQLQKLSADILLSNGALKRAEAELKTYREENPVCPECGAEQEHWAK
jgi:DNA repair ATPase RecN